ncbi:hypothetical protein M3Y99_01015400 [Aphelenchoides fujianensis]|nr:hypothetical protein M3Y99_01015400 [Aphelenchoides fujianensis]
MWRRHLIETTEVVLWTPLAICSAIVIVVLARIKLIHFNLRILMTSMIVDCILGAGARLYFRLLTRHTFLTLADIHTCVVFSFFTLLLFFANCTSFCLMAVERWLATMYSDRYERWSGKFGVIVVCSKYVISILLASAIQAYDFYFLDDQKLAECSFLDGHPRVFGIILVLETVFFTIGIVVSWRLYAFNLKVRTRIGDALSVRFQSKENLAATQMLTAIIIGYALMLLLSLPASAMDVLNLWPRGWSRGMVDVVCEIPYVLLICYSIFYLSYVVFFYDPFYRSATSRLVRWLRLASHPKEEEPPPNQPKMNNEQAGNFHFDQIGREWNVVTPSRRPSSNSPAEQREAEKRVTFTSASAYVIKEEANH